MRQPSLTMMRAVVGLLMACAIPTSHAVGIYKWVDERGVTQISDKVPEKYKASAKRIDSRAFEASDAHRQAATAHADRIMRAAASPPPAVPASTPSGASSPSSRRRSPSPEAAGRAGAADCAASWRAFYDAQACFDKGPKSRGSVNPALNPDCPDVMDPSPRCGAPVLSPQDRAADKPVYPSGDEGRWSVRP